MTISYSLEVSSSGIGTVFKLLVKWRGSVFKALYREFLLYVSAYAIVAVIYRKVLSTSQRHVFERITLFCDTFSSMVPLTFILGFYVSIVFTRWNQIFNSIPWPDQTVLTIASYLSGADEMSKAYRMTIARYMIATEVLILRDISSAVRKRFPTMEHVVNAGLLKKVELGRYEAASECLSHKFYIPTQWVLNLLVAARKEKRIRSDLLLHKCVAALMSFRGAMGGLLCFDWISVPLIYTQTVAIAVWFYFLTTIIGRQYLDPSKNYPGHEIDLYVPIFTFMQFVFYIGWFKAAEEMLNPLGEEDNDFELNYMIDRNLKVAYSIMEEHCGIIPDLGASLIVKTEIPYTEASVGRSAAPMIPSCAQIPVSNQLSRLVSRETVERSRRSSNSALSQRSHTSSHKQYLTRFSSFRKQISKASSSIHGRRSSSSHSQPFQMEVDENSNGSAKSDSLANLEQLMEAQRKLSTQLSTPQRRLSTVEEELLEDGNRKNSKLY